MCPSTRGSPPHTRASRTWPSSSHSTSVFCAASTRRSGAPPPTSASTGARRPPWPRARPSPSSSTRWAGTSPWSTTRSRRRSSRRRFDDFGHSDLPLGLLVQPPRTRLGQLPEAIPHAPHQPSLGKPFDRSVNTGTADLLQRWEQEEQIPNCARHLQSLEHTRFDLVRRAAQDSRPVHHSRVNTDHQYQPASRKREPTFGPAVIAGPEQRLADLACESRTPGAYLFCLGQVPLEVDPVAHP